MSKQQTDKEILIRGRVSKISATLETALARLMLVANIDNRKDEIIKFKGMNLGGKIVKACTILQNYYPDIYRLNNEVFDVELIKAKDFRNRITHGMFKWHDSLSDSFQIWDVKMEEDKVHYFYPYEYTINECLIGMDELKNVTRKVLGIVIDIEDRMKERKTDFWNLL